MRRIALLLLLLLPLIAHAGPVTSDEAVGVARAWMARTEGISCGVSEVRVFTYEGRAALYAVNLTPDGVVFVSADDAALPVVYYSRHGAWGAAVPPPALITLLEQVAADIDAARTAGMKATDAVRTQWAELRSGITPAVLLRRALPPAVAPKLTITWNQNWPYNKFCPTVTSGGSGGRVYAGCVATAMAQILKYSNAPYTGIGSHGYTHATYGYLSADFGSTSYSWSAMPAALTGSSSTTAVDAIATIIYHCGVAVDMDYSPSGSGAAMYKARNALVDYFRCAGGATLQSRSSYGTSAWTALMKSELDNDRLILYCGYNATSSGHAFVLDGYNASDYFHMNFGWGGYLDGYFALNAITPGTNNFNYNQSAIIGIEPILAVPPIAIAPSNGATGVCSSATLSWNAAAGATEYRLQVATDAGFTSLVSDQTVYATSVTVLGLSPNTAYWWHVNATGTGGTSAWTATWGFTTLNTTVTAGGATTFCSGGSVTLSAPAGAGRSYQWFRDGTPLPQGTGASVAATVGGAYSVTISVAGCPTASDPVIVTVLPQPDAGITAGGPTTFCDGGSVVLSVPSTGGASYEWFRNGVLINGQVTPVFVATEAGTYRARVSSAGCLAVSTDVPVTVHAADPTRLVWTGAVSAEWDAPGNWDNPCAIPTLGDDVVIADSCTPPATMPAIQLHDLTMRNTRGVRLDGPVTVTGTLSLLKGNMALYSHDLLLSNGAQLVGGGAASHVITNGTGQFRRSGLGTGGVLATVLFPIAADSAGWTPVSVRNTTMAGGFGARVLPQVLQGGLTGTPVSGSAVGRSWLISGPSDAKADLAFSWTAAEELSGFVRAGSATARSDGGSWTFLQTGAAPAGSPLFTRTTVDVTSLDPLGQVFIVGNAGAVWPVDLLSFTAAADADGVHLAWRTEDEVGNAGFHIERRAGSGDESDGWQRIAFVPGCGATDCAYDHVDNAPIGDLWYRLRQVDLDGTEHVSKAVRVTVPGRDAVLSILAVYPTPLRSGFDALTVEITAHDGPAHIDLCDALGRRLRTLAETVGSAGRRSIRMQPGELAAGMYILIVTQHGAASQRLLPVLRP
jgi:hypothetical protein